MRVFSKPSFNSRYVYPLLLFIFLLGGCSSSLVGGTPKKEALQNIKWSYGKQDIELDINASQSLNLYNGEAHPLALSILQFTDPNTFSAHTQRSEKTASLLLAGSGAEGWLAAKQIFINPGEQQTLRLDRAEKAQYVGVVAGYNGLDSTKISRLYRLGIEYDSSGIFIKAYKAQPAPIQIKLLLGETGIVDTKTSDFIPKKIIDEPKAGLVSPPDKPPAEQKDKQKPDK